MNATDAMRMARGPLSKQAGAYMLEALIGILIFSLGILGIVGLQAASLRTTNDNSIRAEAVYAASNLLGQMWTDSQGALVANYSSPGGVTYKAWAAGLKATQGGAWVRDPTVTFNDAKSNSQQGSYVTVTIFWQTPGGEQHNYSTNGVVGIN